MKVVYYRRALRDLEEIVERLREAAPASADAVLGRIKAAIDNLERWPRLGTPTDNEGRFRFPIVDYPYVIYYRIQDNVLHIQHVRHTSRRLIDPASL